jgi:hypothetical protein
MMSKPNHALGFIWRFLSRTLYFFKAYPEVLAKGSIRMVNLRHFSARLRRVLR